MRNFGVIGMVVALVALPLLSGASLPPNNSNLAPVVASLAELHARLRIPGVAAAIVIDGQMVWRGQWGNLSTTTPREIASITKTMAAVLALQEVEQGHLGLQDLIAGLPGVEVRHLLSHTSVGRPGASFHYNNQRYSALTSIIEHSARQKFAQLLETRIFGPAGMRGTRPAGNSVSGVISHVEDLARYLAALDGDDLLGERQKQWMWMPISPGLPYALGWYSQSYGGQRVVWHYGQLNGYGSSLVIKLPELRANLVVLANSSLLCDTQHLESGDLTRSGVGLKFLEAMAGSRPAESPAMPTRRANFSPRGPSAPHPLPGRSLGVPNAAKRPAKGTPPGRSGSASPGPPNASPSRGRARRSVTETTCVHS